MSKPLKFLGVRRHLMSKTLKFLGVRRLLMSKPLKFLGVRRILMSKPLKRIQRGPVTPFEVTSKTFLELNPIGK